ncbi:MAG: HD domain-containing protein [Ruminococcaceae bacterium]|nr:HD domain-containing protein [Oscillospiraceae bacterium]
MLILCIILVFAGAAILLASIIRYYRALIHLRSEAYADKTFSNWTYVLCMLLMVFFLLGNVALGSVFLVGKAYAVSDLLISLIFFFGAVFVFVVISVQGRMSKAISHQTDEIIRTLVNAMEAKDKYTRGHSVHVMNLVNLFYKYLPDEMRQQINPEHLADAAILHDIGKLGISDIVLNKPGPLTEDEMAVIRTHPRVGKDILAQTSFSELGDIILCHHERIDQRGYYRLPEDQIPLESKIIAIADTFSALYSDRVYRPRKSYIEAMRIIQQSAGTQLDAELASIFTKIPESEILSASRDLFQMEQGAGTPFTRLQHIK